MPIKAIIRNKDLEKEEIWLLNDLMEKAPLVSSPRGATSMEEQPVRLSAERIKKIIEVGRKRIQIYKVIISNKKVIQDLQVVKTR